MSEDTKKAAWLEYCNKLEALGVDPYAADLPADDSRHEQVQAIVAEYKAATTHKLARPPNWEGHAPIQQVDSLPDLAEWLAFQWSLIKGWELAGEKAKPSALNDASRAIRNAFRVLDWLGVEDHPKRPLPTDDLETVKTHIDDLERWIRQKHKAGWKPSPKQAPVKMANQPVKRKRRDAIPDDQANLLAGKFLKQNPEADSRELAKGIGIALGRVSKLPAWRAVNARRIVARLPLKKTPLPLTKKMIESIKSGEDPAVIVEAREAAWRKVIETASEDKKAELFAMSKGQQIKLIDLTWSSVGTDSMTAKSVRERSRPFLNRFPSRTPARPGFFRVRGEPPTYVKALRVVSVKNHFRRHPHETALHSITFFSTIPAFQMPTDL